MATEQIPPSVERIPLDTATLIAQLRRDNERLQNRSAQLEEQARALLVLQEIANTLSAELRLPLLLRRIAIAALRLTAAQSSVVYLVDASRSALVVKAVETTQTVGENDPLSPFSSFDFAEDSRPGATDDDEAEEQSLPHVGLHEGVAGWVASTGMLVLVPDTATDPRFPATTLAVDELHLGMPTASLVAVPMAFKGVVTGVLEVAQSANGGGFDASCLDLMRTLAAQAATAVANALLYRRLRAERDRIIQTQEDERKRLGRDLHDGPAQKVAQIAMALEFAEQLVTREPERLIPELRAIREQALSATREIRNQLFDLRPLVLDAETGGLIAALRHFFDRFQNGQGPTMHLASDYPDRLSHNIEITTFAIIQEAVNNVLKHANARNCWVDIRQYPDKLIATIRDDGDGFDVRTVQAEYENRGSWGLLSMLERAALIEGRLNIASQPGKGTITSLEVPR